MSNMKITRGQFMNKIAMDAFNDEFTKLAADAVVEENKSAVTPTKSLWSGIKGVGKSISDIYSVKQLHDGLKGRETAGNVLKGLKDAMKDVPEDKKKELEAYYREAHKDDYEAYDRANKDIAVGALKTVGAYGIPVAGTIGGIILAKKMKERKRRQQGVQKTAANNKIDVSFMRDKALQDLFIRDGVATIPRPPKLVSKFNYDLPNSYHEQHVQRWLPPELKVKPLPTRSPFSILPRNPNL